MVDDRATQGAQRTGQGDACGKAILFGEHFVVHGLRALAVPLPSLRTRATITSTAGARDAVEVIADVEHREPVIEAVRRATNLLGLRGAWSLRTESSVPLGCGLGSSAAFAVALLRALLDHEGRREPTERISALAWELEKIAHGTPSGVDNTVVAHERAIAFRKGTAPVLLTCASPLHLIVADSGQRHPTAEAVGRVHAFASASPGEFGRICADVESLVTDALGAFTAGDAERLGGLMNDNHALLDRVGVSSPLLDRLNDAARGAGALGAKLTGAGVGGSVIALAAADRCDAVRSALAAAGARTTFVATLCPPATKEPA